MEVIAGGGGKNAKNAIPAKTVGGFFPTSVVYTPGFGLLVVDSEDTSVTDLPRPSNNKTTKLFVRRIQPVSAWNTPKFEPKEKNTSDPTTKNKTKRNKQTIITTTTVTISISI